MIGIGLSVAQDKRGGIILPQTKALFERAGDEGFDLPSYDCKLAINSDISVQMAAGIFDKSDRIFYAANDSGSINFGRISAASPAGDLGSIHGSLAHANKQGIKGNGTDAYFNSLFDTSSDPSNYSLNSAHIYVSQYFVGTGRLVGLDTSGSFLNFNAASSVGQKLNGSVNLGTAANFAVTGTVGINRNNSTQVQFITGGTITTTTAVSDSLPNGDITILRNDSNYGSSGISLVRIGSGLTDVQQALIITLDAAYMLKMAAL